MHADGPPPKPFKDSAFNPLWLIGLGLVALSLWHLYVRSTQPPDPSPPPRPPTAQQAAPLAESPVSPQAAAPRPAPALAVRPVHREPEPALRESPPERTTLYLCKSYGGGRFWSTALCSSHRATIDRIVNVPGHLPFDQQVAIAEGERAEAAKLYAPPPQAVTRNTRPGFDKSAECARLEDHIRQLDAMARQPQSGHTQDWIRNARMKARSRQAALRC